MAESLTGDVCRLRLSHGAPVAISGVRRRNGDGRGSGIAACHEDPQYLAEGVLVCTVTTSLDGHPISVAHDNGRGYLSDFPLLDVGDSVSVAGYTITVLNDTGSEHIVSIRKNS